MRQEILFQRVEAGALFAVSTYFYFDLGLSILAYIVFLFVFDVFMVGYLKNPQIGAYLYNLGHSLALPLILLIPSVLSGNNLATGAILLWFAHIGLDRLLGYGLKLESGFSRTHLGDIAKNRTKTTKNPDTR